MIYISCSSSIVVKGYFFVVTTLDKAGSDSIADRETKQFFAKGGEKVLFKVGKIERGPPMITLEGGWTAEVNIKECKV